MEYLKELLRRLTATLKTQTRLMFSAVVNRFAGITMQTEHTHSFKFETYSPVSLTDLLDAFRLDGLPGVFIEDFRRRIPAGKEERISVGYVQNFLAQFRQPLEHWQALMRSRVKWVEIIPANLVVNTGLDDVLDKYYKGSTYTAAHYCGLTDGTPSFAGADTMASHAGWTEVTAYDEANRQTITWGTVSGQSVDNSASKATFTISANGTTIGGALVSTDSTKGGSTGTLVGGAAFSAGDKTLDDDDTLNVTVAAAASAS